IYAAEAGLAEVNVAIAEEHVLALALVVDRVALLLVLGRAGGGDRLGVVPVGGILTRVGVGGNREVSLQRVGPAEPGVHRVGAGVHVLHAVAGVAGDRGGVGRGAAEVRLRLHVALGRALVVRVGLGIAAGADEDGRRQILR